MARCGCGAGGSCNCLIEAGFQASVTGDGSALNPFIVGYDGAAESFQRKTSAPALPRLAHLITDYRDDLAPAVNIVGMGSSVAVGATLPDPATQAPSAYFASRVNAVLDPLNRINFVHYNRGVNGTAFADAAAKYAAIKAEPVVPDIVVLAYGMNDGQSALYHAGQTYPFVYNDLVQLIAQIRADGHDVVVMTTPHPHTGRDTWDMPFGIPVTYPAAGVMVPNATLAQSIVTADYLANGHAVPASYRHLRVNEAMRAAAVDAGCPIIDVEKYWFDAVYRLGEDALFNPGEYVHPNLVGHQQSYWLAIADFVTNWVQDTNLGGQNHTLLFGRTGINTPVTGPAASLDVIPTVVDAIAAVPVSQFSMRGAGPTYTPLVVANLSAVTGIQNFRKELDALLLRFGSPENDAVNGLSATLEDFPNYNMAAGVASTVATVNDKDFALILVRGDQPGVALRTGVLLFCVGQAAAVTIVQVAGINVGSVFPAATASGFNVQVTPVFNNTNLRVTRLISSKD